MPVKASFACSVWYLNGYYPGQLRGQVHVIITVICESQIILIHTTMGENNLLIQTKLIIKLILSLSLSLSLSAQKAFKIQ